MELVVAYLVITYLLQMCSCYASLFGILLYWKELS